MIIAVLVCFIIIVTVFILLGIGEFQCYNTPKGRKQARKEYENQKKIEKEFGTIEYWEDK